LQVLKKGGGVFHKSRKGKNPRLKPDERGVQGFTRHEKTIQGSEKNISLSGGRGESQRGKGLIVTGE